MVITLLLVRFLAVFAGSVHALSVGPPRVNVAVCCVCAVPYCCVRVCYATCPHASGTACFVRVGTEKKKEDTHQQG